MTSTRNLFFHGDVFYFAGDNQQYDEDPTCLVNFEARQSMGGPFSGHAEQASKL